MVILYMWRRWAGYGVFFPHVDHASAIPRSLPYAFVAAGLSLAFGYTDGYDIENPTAVLTPSLTTMGFIITYRANLAYQRYWQGRTDLAIMSSKIKDIALQGSSWSKSGAFKSEVLRLLIAFHSAAADHLQQQRSPQDTIADLAARKLISTEEAELLAVTGSIPYQIWRWLYVVFSQHSVQGGFFMAPPIQSRSYQVMSDMMVAYNNCAQLMDTPFPFPFAQICFLALHVLLVFVPWVAARFVADHTAAAVVSFFVILLFFGINFTAAYIESPFGGHPNCLPLVAFGRSVQADLCIILHPGFSTPDSVPSDFHSDGAWPEGKWEAYFAEQLQSVGHSIELGQPTIEAIKASAEPRVSQVVRRTGDNGPAYVLVS